MKGHIKAAIAQAGSILFDTRRSIEKLGDLTVQAAAQGADLLVFPEAFIGGYPKGADFGARLGMRLPNRRDEYRRYLECGIALEGREMEQIRAIAARNHIHLVGGIIERDGSTLYCTAVIIGPDGKLLGRHRKLMPTAIERIVWGMGDGSDIVVPKTKIGNVGAVICWENYMPLLRTAMYSKGVQLYCAPTVDDRDTWAPLMRTIAVEGRCFVISACQFLTRAGVPADFPSDLSAYAEAPDTPVIKGGSCIMSPLGDVLLEPFSGEGVAVVELDMADIQRGKYDLDVVGHYARPDIFTLTVDQRPKNGVVSVETEADADQPAPSKAPKPFSLFARGTQ